MPDTLNKQTLINLLIDSPLREPIKINLIDIVNNTNEPDLPKVYSTITKELEIFKKATERRMKLAEETITKLGGTVAPVGDTTPAPVGDTPPAPVPNVPPTSPVIPSAVAESPTLTIPPLDLPTMPTTTQDAVTPNFQPLGGAPMSSNNDEDALVEIQKELDSLKTASAADVASASTPTPQA
ncbi:hypothetical protein COT87_01720 [Candidatus Collierbacteria bacterium CG10_big_fil_rev_8_21_14_0_10_44_9]|uniref:Uncharacterized protein n=1 Tax=Candidatus Collierbacteria bacterium CG10_big_fil_rev_8_21_14_0_10_44_9 TaxID=1974535 RepID=A0A2H0VIT9_9BACT|nr:MAG: hypothetical protein COT87_01720 [Candidatus Collierbacteria bacterium CG10_big_fil_rev_8_21_14_0_10_44_9]